MKKILLITLLLSNLVLGQKALDNFNGLYSENNKKAYLKANKYRSGVSVSPTLGLGMLLGGSAFIVAGALTSPTYVGGSTTQLKPFYDQPGFYPILTGTGLVIAGIIISIN